MNILGVGLNKMLTQHIWRSIAGGFILVVAGGLVACGGGGSSSSVGLGPRPSVPPSTSVPSSHDQVEYTLRLSSASPEDGVDYRTSEFNAHHGLDMVRADAAYKRGYFGQGATIAIIENAFDVQHADLAANMLTNPDHLLGEPGHTWGERAPDSYMVEPSERLEEATRNIHGTYVALFAAGVRGNDRTDGTVRFVDGSNSDAVVKDMHGVAPMATILPMQNRAPGTREVFAVAATAAAHVVNASFGAPLPFAWARQKDDNGDYRPGFWLFGARSLPIFAPFLEDDPAFRGEFLELSRNLQNQANGDKVFVWAGGNDHWHTGESLRACGKVTREQDGCHDPENPDSPPDPSNPTNDREFTQEEFIRNFDFFQYDLDDQVLGTLTLSELWDSGTPIDTPTGTIYADFNDPGGWANAPLFESGLIGKWLVVGSVNRNTVISSFSNGCGISKNWCLVAPGEQLDIFSNNGPPNGRFPINGTSFSAPIVSGALAVLRSRHPNMPMEVALAILLTTADPLGNRITLGTPDDIYGWGLANLSAAINLQGEVVLVSVRPASSGSNTNAAGVRLSQTRIHLPARFAHIEQRLASIETAVGGVGGAYYNAQLSDFAEVSAAAPWSLGDAADDLMRPAQDGRVNAGIAFTAVDDKTGQFRYAGADFGDAANGFRFRADFCDDCESSTWRDWHLFNEQDDIAAAPFFAAESQNFVLQMRGDGLRPFATVGGEDAPYSQIGLRWRQNEEKFGYLAELSHIAERKTFWGADFGALGQPETMTRQARFALRGNLSQQWQMLASYRTARGESQTSDDGWLQKVSGLRSDQWSANLQGRDLLQGDDLLRISILRDLGIEGSASFRHLRAEGNFTCGFLQGAMTSDEFANFAPCQNASANTVSEHSSTIDLDGGARTSLAVGYMFRPADKTRLAFGAQYQTQSSTAAFSASFQMDF